MHSVCIVRVGLSEELMNAFHKVDINHLKLIFPFLKYHDILNFLCSSHIIYDSLICETRQITISFKGLLKLLQDQSFFLSKIVDPSKQLSIFLEDEEDRILQLSGGKEALLQSVKPSFPYFLLTPEMNFPPLLKLSCPPIFFIYLCEVYPGFTVRKLKIFEVLEEALSVYLSPHLTCVLEELILPSLPSNMIFPQLSPTLQSLRFRKSSSLSSLPPLPNLKHLRIEACQNTDLDLTPYDLETLQLIHPSILDFEKINTCKRLVVHSPEAVKNIKKAKQFQIIEFADIDVKDLPNETLQSVKELKLAYSIPKDLFSINLSSFINLERFELSGFSEEDYDDDDLVLHVNGIAPSSLKAVKISAFANTLNMSWFSKVYEIFLDDCTEVTSLLGLEKVPRVILRCLQIESLQGLGGNSYVELFGCEWIEDFSALKYVREVKIEGCIGPLTASDVAYVQKLSIIGCDDLKDLSGLVEVKELYLKNCHNVVYCDVLDKIPKVSITHCKKLRHMNKISLNKFGVRDRGIKDGLSSLPDSLHLEVLKYLENYEIRMMISCNTYFYQRYCEITSSSSTNRLVFRERPYTIVSTSFKTDDVPIPSTVKVINFEFCRFSCPLNLVKGLKRLQFNTCRGLSNITDFSVAEEVIIQRVSPGDSLNLASLNRVKRLTLDDCDIINDYSSFQDNEEITVKHRNIAFKGSKAFSNSKKIKLYFDIFVHKEIDLSFYRKVEIFHLSRGGPFNCNGPCPATLKKLCLSGLTPLTLPPGLNHLHLLSIFDCSLTSLQAVGSIPNIRLSHLPCLNSLEGLGPGNEFVQLLYLEKVDDFSVVSGCRKVVIWGCPKFKDVSAYAESNYLVIGECDSLVDVSMLGKVKHLELIRCKNIWSLKGLEGVKELIVSDCRLLEDQNNSRHRAWTVLPKYDEW